MKDEIRLAIPTIEDKEKVLDFKQEFITNGEPIINGSDLLDLIDTYEEWLQKVTDNKTKEKVDTNWVVTDSYLAYNHDNGLIGIIDLRHTLNEMLKDFGHIGYSVRPTERKKGYATQMLSKVIEIGREKGIFVLQLSCMDTNIGSNKTILNNGGILERTFDHEGKVANVYKVYESNITPIINTERLLLRPLNVNDAQEVYDGWTGNKAVAKFMRWNLHNNIDDTKEWLSGEEDSINNPLIYNWGFILKETNKVIGSGGLLYSEHEQMYEIGYNLNQNYWNKGLATEATKAIIRFGFTHLHLKSIYATYAKDNTASGRVLEKSGFRVTGEGEYYSFDHTRSFQSIELILNNTDNREALYLGNSIL